MTKFFEQCHWCKSPLVAPGRRTRRSKQKRYLWRGLFFCITCLPKFLEGPRK